jgi:hypothetical protein
MMTPHWSACVMVMESTAEPSSSLHMKCPIAAYIFPLATPGGDFYEEKGIVLIAKHY